MASKKEGENGRITAPSLLSTHTHTHTHIDDATRET